MDMIFVNAYIVTRHYGGPEEGGWWWNQKTPIASVPFAARRVDGHEPGQCRECDKVRETGEGAFCKEEPDEETATYEWQQFLDNFMYTHENASGPAAKAAWDNSEEYQATLVTVTHLEAEDDEIVEGEVERLKELFSHEKEGDIYSVLGGQDLLVMVEDEPGKLDPAERPHYE